MAKQHIVVHFHELWLKGGNRRFFLGRLITALRQSLEDVGLARLHCPGDRILVELAPGAPVEPAMERVARVLGVAHFALAHEMDRDDNDRELKAICDAAWEEVAPESFRTFAVRAKRSDKSFPLSSAQIETIVGRHLLNKIRNAGLRNAGLREDGRDIRVDLNAPDLTCRIEVMKDSALVYARKISGAGGMPANTAGRLMCLLSGGFDSAVAAYKMMRRGAHVSFVHFWGGGADPGESSVHVARELVRKLVPYQFTAKLYLVPFEPLQREIVDKGPASFRILLYRRLMLRIAEQLALRTHSLGLVTGDSVGQVASQTLHNMAAVGAAARMQVYRPLAGDDKQEIIEMARKIGTHDISAEPFHDCCPMFLPRNPALHATAAELDECEVAINMEELVRRGVDSATLERFRFASGRVELVESVRTTTA
ncbi:MAG TPA: tRNA uracil 4-sulfurtransferase ThiI [Candidatus Limnocylindrales bacterium]|nr:tRNA uracil 4-sulfurtransferase ThiI [Candidatus Limnocylindrales bacterium]